jgi:phosphotriesterase-related protein
MAQVQTVTGPIDAEQLGRTLIHEHLRTRDEAVHEQWPSAGTTKEDEPLFRPAGRRVRVAVREAKAAIELGVRTIADPSAMFLGRDVSFMRRVRRRPASRWCLHGHLHLRPSTQFFLTRDPDQIAEFFVSDISRIQGTRSRRRSSGRRREPRVNEHRAPSRRRPSEPADRRSDHSPLTAARTPARARSRSSWRRASIRRRSRWHTGDTDDLGYIEGVLEGCLDRLDRYGLELFLPYDKRQSTAKALIERGYADRIFLSADSCATLDWYPAEAVEQLIAAEMAKDWTIRIVPEKVLPELRDAGMTAEQERTMMVDNAVRWLTG